jgi:hypothetical protein
VSGRPEGEFNVFRFKIRTALVALTAIAALAVPATALATNVTRWDIDQRNDRIDNEFGPAGAPYANQITALWDDYRQGDVTLPTGMQVPYPSSLVYGDETFGVHLTWHTPPYGPDNLDDYQREFIRRPGHYVTQQIPASEHVALYDCTNVCSEGSVEMAEALTKRGPVVKTARAECRGVSSARRVAVVDRTTELSDDVLRAVEAGQRAAIEAVRKFVDTVDRTLPHFGEGPSRPQELVDSALEMADRLVHTQYDFIRKVVDSAGESLSRPDGAKSNGGE